MRKPTIWVPTRSDTNQAVKSHKMVRGWKILDLESRGIVQSLFSPMQVVVFSMRGSNVSLYSKIHFIRTNRFKVKIFVV